MTTTPTGFVRKTARILGLPVDIVTKTDALSAIEGFLSQDSPKLIATADASGLSMAQSDPEFHQILQTADLVTPDSIGVIWAGRRGGHDFRERVSGVELVDEICAMSAEKGYRIYLLGAGHGVAELAAEKLRLKHPGCNIVGARHGFFPASDDEVIAAEVALTRPDVLFVAMGIPRQEKFIRKTEHIIGAKVAMGVGGSFDVFSGKVRRAPVFIQKLHLEWLWRTLANPKKISKAKHLPKFVWRVLTERR